MKSALVTEERREMIEGIGFSRDSYSEFDLTEIINGRTVVTPTPFISHQRIAEEKTVQIYGLENNRYKIFSFAEGEGAVKSKLINGLEVNITEIFHEN
ncbi:MAG: hypothetical protein U0586_13055 [Candidatus Brocadiaceae bacterium]